MCRTGGSRQRTTRSSLFAQKRINGRHRSSIIAILAAAHTIRPHRRPLNCGHPSPSALVVASLSSPSAARNTFFAVHEMMPIDRDSRLLLAVSPLPRRAARPSSRRRALMTSSPRATPPGVAVVPPAPAARHQAARVLPPARRHTRARPPLGSALPATRTCHRRA